LSLYAGTVTPPKKRRIEMKRWSSVATVLVLSTMLSIGFFRTSAFAWSQSFHAYVAKKCLHLENKYIASYNARMGAVVPDFFWYLGDTDWIDPYQANTLHGSTEEGCQDGTTYFYEVSSGLLNWLNYRLIYFTEGIKTHVLADILAHDVRDGDNNSYPDGYIEWWVSILTKKLATIGDPMAGDREVLHLALEFAVDSIVINLHGLQVSDLLFSYTQANFLEKAVREALDGTVPDGLDVSAEFKKYLALVRVLEKAAALYAGCLIEGKVDQRLLAVLDSNEFLAAERELSDGALGLYLQVLPILVNYPREIYQTLMGDMGGPDLMALLGDMEGFCTSLDTCP
jgi:hypothetical protein